MNSGQLIALEENLPRLKALEKIDRGEYDGRDHKTVYHLWLTAYGDEELARRAQAQAVQNLVDSKCGKM